MDSYPQRVRDSILPLSVAGSLPHAFAEWHFTGRTTDHERPCEICQLCGQDGLRYHFEIANQLTGHQLEVGSHCILQFDVAVYDGGKRLSPKEAKKKLIQLTEKMRLNSCIKALEALARTEQSEILVNALEYYRKNKKLTPKQAFVVFWRLQRHAIDHSPSFFKVTLQKERYRNDLESMPTDRVRLFWSALTPGQKRKAIALGHAIAE